MVVSVDDADFVGSLREVTVRAAVSVWPSYASPGIVTAPVTLALAPPASGPMVVGAVVVHAALETYTSY